MGNSFMTCVVGLIMPIWFLPASVNQILPSGPWTIPYGWAPGVIAGKSEIWSVAVLITPIWFVLNAVNQTVPFGPAVIPSTCGVALLGRGISVMCPVVGLMKPNWSAVCSKNQ